MQILQMKMKGIDILCASQASTAICLSMDQASSSTIQLGGRAIDRHNPIISDERRTVRRLTSSPSSAQPPINPKPHDHHHQKSKKGSSNSLKKGKDSKRKSFGKHGSARYLLGDTAYLDGLSDYDSVLALVPVESKKTRPVNQEEFRVSEPSSSSVSKAPSSDQVVVLRVSLHCKGCEGKVRKHLSRMEGVTSFSIDFAAKKVTIIGDVTPLNVLESVSKVKKAEFWTSSAVVSAKVNDDIKK